MADLQTQYNTDIVVNFDDLISLLKDKESDSISSPDSSIGVSTSPDSVADTSPSIVPSIQMEISNPSPEAKSTAFQFANINTSSEVASSNINTQMNSGQNEITNVTADQVNEVSSSFEFTDADENKQNETIQDENNAKTISVTEEAKETEETPKMEDIKETEQAEPTEKAAPTEEVKETEEASTTEEVKETEEASTNNSQPEQEEKSQNTTFSEPTNAVPEEKVQDFSFDFGDIVKPSNQATDENTAKSENLEEIKVNDTEDNKIESLEDNKITDAENNETSDLDMAISRHIQNVDKELNEPTSETKDIKTDIQVTPEIQNTNEQMMPEMTETQDTTVQNTAKVENYNKTSDTTTATVTPMTNISLIQKSDTNENIVKPEDNTEMKEKLNDTDISYHKETNVNKPELAKDESTKPLDFSFNIQQNASKTEENTANEIQQIPTIQDPVQLEEKTIDRIQEENKAEEGILMNTANTVNSVPGTVEKDVNPNIDKDTGSIPTDDANQINNPMISAPNLSINDTSTIDRPIEPPKPAVVKPTNQIIDYLPGQNPIEKQINQPENIIGQTQEIQNPVDTNVWKNITNTNIGLNLNDIASSTSKTKASNQASNQGISLDELSSPNHTAEINNTGSANINMPQNIPSIGNTNPNKSIKKTIFTVVAVVVFLAFAILYFYITRPLFFTNMFGTTSNTSDQHGSGELTGTYIPSKISDMVDDSTNIGDYEDLSGSVADSTNEDTNIQNDNTENTGKNISDDISVSDDLNVNDSNSSNLDDIDLDKIIDEKVLKQEITTTTGITDENTISNDDTSTVKIQTQEEAINKVNEIKDQLKTIASKLTFSDTKNLFKIKAVIKVVQKLENDIISNENIDYKVLSDNIQNIENEINKINIDLNK